MKCSEFEVNSGKLFICHFYSDGIGAAIKFGLDPEALLRRGVGDQIDDHLVTDERAATPVLCDVAKHPMLNLVPLAGAWREMTDMDRYSQPVGQFL